MTKKQEQQKIQNELLYLSFLILKYSRIYTRNTLYKKYKDQIQYISIRRINQSCKKYNLDMLSEREYKTGLVYDTMTQDEFISNATSVHGGYDYSRTKYLRSHDKVNIICPEHGEFQMMPYSHLQGRGCPRCILSGTSRAEKEILGYIQSDPEIEELRTMWCNPLVSKNQISEKLGVSLHVLDTFKKKYNLGKKITSRKVPSQIDLEVYPEHEIRSSMKTFYGTKKLYNLDNRSKYSFEYMCNFYGIEKSDFINQTEITRESNKIETPGPEFIEHWNNPDLMKEDLREIYGVKNSTLERFSREYGLDRKASRTGTSRAEKEILGYIENETLKNKNLNLVLRIEQKGIRIKEYRGLRTKVDCLCICGHQFRQTPEKLLREDENNKRLDRISGCPECSKKKIVLDILSTLPKVYDFKIQNYACLTKTSKIQGICLEHGDFWTTIKAQEKGTLCPGCARDKQSNTQKDSKESFIKKYSDRDLVYYDLSDIDYKASDVHIEVPCPQHGTFKIRPYHLLQGQGCPRCVISGPEKEILGHIQSDPPSEDLDMIEDWKSSKITVNEMSRKYNLSEQVIARRMKPYGHKKRSRNPKSHDLDQYLDDIRTMYQGNYSYQEIQDKYSVGLVVLKRFAQQHGLGKKKKPNRNIPHDTMDYIKEAQKVHPGSVPGSSKYRYDLVDYKNSETKIEIICPQHGSWKTLPGNHLYRKSGCPRCIISGPEKEIRENLPGAVSGDRTVLDGKEIDILVKNYSFGIEYNGLMWHSIGSSKYSRFHREDTLENRTKHLNKTDLAEKKGIQLFHIFENEWLDPIKKRIWKSVINNKLKKNISIMARKCEIRYVDKNECDLFEDLNHLQGRGTASVRLGLYFQDELVQIMTFSKGRMISSDSEYEMIRTCSLLDHHIQGGSSKLFKYFIKIYKPRTITSFANRRWSQGGLYEQLGFELSHISKPCYFYFRSKVLYNRVSFQKHKLKKKLEHFDPDLTEWENMDRNGYRKIYDCGNYVYKYSSTQVLKYSSPKV